MCLFLNFFWEEDYFLEFVIILGHLAAEILIFVCILAYEICLNICLYVQHISTPNPCRLRDRLVKIITDYRTETSLRKGCNEILKVSSSSSICIDVLIVFIMLYLIGLNSWQTDCVNLLIKYYKEAQRAVCLGGTEEEKHANAEESSSTQESRRGSSARSIELKSRTRGSGRCCLCFDPFSIQTVSVVVFFCCHAYHVTCLTGDADSINMGSFVANSDDDKDDDEDAPSGGSRIRCVLCTTASG